MNDSFARMAVISRHLKLAASPEIQQKLASGINKRETARTAAVLAKFQAMQELFRMSICGNRQLLLTYDSIGKHLCMRCFCFSTIDYCSWVNQTVSDIREGMGSPTHPGTRFKREMTNRSTHDGVCALCLTFGRLEARPRELGHDKCCGTDSTKFITQYRWLDSIHIGLPFPTKFATLSSSQRRNSFSQYLRRPFLVVSLTTIIPTNSVVLLAIPLY